MIKQKWIGHILTAVASAGYYGYYIKTHELLIMWIIIFAIGIIILSAANNTIFKIYHSKLVYLDILFILFVCLFPLIPLQKGMSILLMMIIACIYAFTMTRQRYE